jgi:hypothetical protein
MRPKPRNISKDLKRSTIIATMIGRRATRGWVDVGVRGCQVASWSEEFSNVVLDERWCISNDQFKILSWQSTRTSRNNWMLWCWFCSYAKETVFFCMFLISSLGVWHWKSTVFRHSHEEWSTQFTDSGFNHVANSYYLFLSDSLISWKGSWI